MKRRMIGVLLTAVMICSTAFFVKADQVKIQENKKRQVVIRSIILDPSHLLVNLDKNLIS